MMLATCPDDALQLILCYVGDGVTLLNVEKTCRRLKTAVENDTVWAVPPPIVMLVNGVPKESDDWAEDTRFASNRERACVSKNLLTLRLEQECTSNILIEELGTDGYTALAHVLLGHYRRNAGEKILLREDTLEALAELVQHGIVLQLQRSLALVAFGAGSGYPTVTLTSIEQQAELADTLECFPSRQESYPDRINRELLNAGIDTRTRDRVVRRLSYRAGVPKMANNTYNFVWETILHLTEKILLPACFQLDGLYPSWAAMADMIYEEWENGYEKTNVQSWRMTRYVPPNLCLKIINDHCDELVVMTPVPGQLEESSARLGLAGRVYSVLGDPSSIAAVQENYEVTEDIVVIKNKSDGNISGFVDHCWEDDEESDFSVYSDASEDMMFTGDDLDEAVEACPRLFRK
jgi:hypothetical protein